jgi:hypothetical protein
VSADLVEFDDAQRFIRAVVLQQGFETLCSREVFEGQRSMAAVLAPQQAVGVSARFFWAWMLATTPDVA